jgi:soluble lytic murein transglycosylase
MTMPAYWGPIIRVRWPKFAAALLGLSCLHAQDLASLTRAYRDDPSPAHRTALQQYAGSHKDAMGALALLSLGVKELELKQFNDAQEHLDGTPKRLPTIVDYPAYLSAAARYENGKYGEVEKALKPVWDRSPASPLVAKAVILLANAFLRDNQPKKAQELVQQRWSDLKVSDAEILLAHALEAQGDAAAAGGHYQRVLVDFPLSKEDEDAESDPARLAALTPKARLARCLHLIDGGGYARAKKELEPLVAQLTGYDAEAARLNIGIAQHGAKAYGAAYTYLQGLQLTAPELDAQRLNYLVRCARRLDRPQDFRAPLERLAGAYPKSKWRLQAYLAAGDFYWLQHDLASAEQIYRPCAQAFPTAADSSDCQWRVAWTDYVRRRPAALDELKALVKQVPGSEHVATSLYFLARAAEAKNDWGTARVYYEEINTWYPNFYYAMLARDRLKVPQIAKAAPAAAASDWLKSISFPSRSRTDNFVASPAMKARADRARLLASAGLDDLADSELRFAAKKDGQPEVAAVELAELAAQREAPNVGIRAIKQLAPNYLRIAIDTAPDRFWKLAFPLPFRASLEEFSKAQGLDPFIVAALIRQESEFNPKIVSHANAYGLTQVVPATGREIGRKLKMARFTVDMLFRPEINLQIGTYYLRWLMDRSEGKWEATLASYNAGPGRVAKWLTWGEFREPAEFVETIPFDETRNYVQSVLRNADVYRRLYGGKVAVASAK